MTDDVKLHQPEQEIVKTAKSEIACDGGGPATGHPRVLLHMENGQVECPYCDRLFVFDADVD